MARKSIGAYLWGLAILTFVFGDVVTTVIGLRVPGVIEGNALPAGLLSEFGITSLLGLKAVAVALLFGAYIFIGNRYENHPNSVEKSIIFAVRLGLPLSAAIIGMYAVVNNLDVILRALSAF